MKRVVTVELTVETNSKRKSDVDHLVKAALKGRFATDADKGSVEILSVRPQPDYRKIPLR